MSISITAEKSFSIAPSLKHFTTVCIHGQEEEKNPERQQTVLVTMVYQRSIEA